MKKILFAATALAALAAATPAAAQYGSRYPSQYDQSRYGQDVSFNARIDALRARLDAGIRNGTIDRREAWPLRRELAQLQQLEARYRYDGYSDYERDDLRQRLRSLRAEIRVADNGGWDRYERYGMWTGYDTGSTRYGSGYGSYGSGYTGYGNAYTGSGGPYEPVVVCERRNGIIGFIDAIAGTRDCFEVGQRVTFDLDPVPYSYRDTYRDSGNVYYRSDGKAIYAIDARTNTVLEVHRLPR